MYSSITDPNTQKSNISNNSNVLDNTTKELSKKDRFHADCTPASFF